MQADGIAFAIANDGNETVVADAKFGFEHFAAVLEGQRLLCLAVLT